MKHLVINIIIALQRLSLRVRPGFARRLDRVCLWLARCFRLPR